VIKNIAGKDFLLSSRTAKRLYSDYAERMPIIDFHCHLSPAEIAGDKRFSDIGELMLGADHYKWRAMRSFGIDEKYITGDAPFRDKFRKFAGMLPYAAGNPLYAWTHLELARYFGIEEALDARSADRIYDRCGELLAGPGFSAKELILRSNVEVVCTTDDPADSLIHHKKVREDSRFGVKVLPAFRPDRAVNIRERGVWKKCMEELGAEDYPGLLSALDASMKRFGELGCRLSDHGLQRLTFRTGDPEAVFKKAIGGGEITPDEEDVFITSLMTELGRRYAEAGWCMQLHLGPMRNNNTAMFGKVGRDAGFDAIGDPVDISSLSRFLDGLAAEDRLPKTVLYSLDGNDLCRLCALMGCFQEGPVRSKIQLGPAWWFNDQRDGMEAQLRALANLGVIGGFVGMLTDSRSFLSYTRHEYFRRILCALVGGWIDGGEYPDDPDTAGRLIGDICYHNAKNYFGF
jgi:glucuronate isomerase